MDLLPLLAMLSDADKRAMTGLARDLRAEASLAASLVLLRALFPAVPLGPLAEWTDARAQSPAVRIRLARYCEMLGLERDWRSSPIDNRKLAVESSWRIFETASVRARIMLLGPRFNAGAADRRPGLQVRAGAHLERYATLNGIACLKRMSTRDMGGFSGLRLGLLSFDGTIAAGFLMRFAAAQQRVVEN